MPARLKITLATAAFLLAGAVGSGGAPRPAVADTEIDVSFFYTSLAPLGDWVRVEPYGWAWAPENVPFGWRPYTMGQWAWVEPYGWTWISADPWGWATDHYGRWTYVDDYGWVWVPGTTWGPAWVAFRYSDRWAGWAPMPPGPRWSYDADYDVTGLNAAVNIGTYAWSFVPLRYFAEPDLSSRLLVSAYNPYLVQNTQWSTRYAPVEGGFANQSVDVALVEKARGTTVVRRRLREATAPAAGAGARVEGDAVVVYRPHIAKKAPALAPTPRVDRSMDLNAWTAARQAALKAHLEAQKKALEQQDVLPAAAPQPQPGAARDADAAKRREAAQKALEDERKRLEDLIERQRKRREMDLKQPVPPAQPKPPPPPAMGDEDHGMKDDDHGMKDDDHGMKDDDHGMK